MTDSHTTGKVSTPLHVDPVERDAPAGTWVTRPVSESVTDAMERAPMGAVYEIVNAVLARRLKYMLDPSGPLSELLTSSLVADAVNFRAINPNYRADAGRAPAAAPGTGAGAGSYHSKIWGPNPDERLPHTPPLPTPETHALEADPSKGLLVSKVFADLQHHIPCVLFNVTNKEYRPIGLAGSSVTKKFRHKGQTVTELGYQVTLSVEATLVTGDDNSTSHLQALVEACFGTLRDQIGGGACITGHSWELRLPARLSTSNITEVDAPWSGGDDKGSKLYTATVGLEEMAFECYMYIGKPVQLLVSNHIDEEPLSMSVPGERDLTKPIVLKLGQSVRLIIRGAPLTADVLVDQGKRVLEVRRPVGGGWYYDVIARRTGTATISLYNTGMTVMAQTPTTPVGRLGPPLVQRKVVVVAV